eukprot:6148933-Amphidinium_carterae.1
MAKGEKVWPTAQGMGAWTCNPPSGRFCASSSSPTAEWEECPSSNQKMIFIDKWCSGLARNVAGGWQCSNVSKPIP